MHIFQGVKKGCVTTLDCQNLTGCLPSVLSDALPASLIPTLRATAGPAHSAAATGSVFQPAPASQCSLKEALGEPGHFGAPLRTESNKIFFYIICHTAWVNV